MGQQTIAFGGYAVTVPVPKRLGQSLRLGIRGQTFTYFSTLKNVDELWWRIEGDGGSKTAT